ncbi:hypothetical protein BH23GEM6_BH23GEM6_02210 [soil metagenome]
MRSIYMGGMTLLLLAATLVVPAAAAAQRVAQGQRVVPLQTRGWFGFEYSPVRANGSPSGPIAVVQVQPGSGSARGGLQVGDTIVRWNGRTDVVTAIQENAVAPDDAARVRVRKNARQRDLTMVAGQRPRTPVIGRSEDGQVIIIDPRQIEREARALSAFMLPHIDTLGMRAVGIRADSLHSRIRVMLRDSLGPRLRELERLPRASFQIGSDSIWGRGPMIFDLESGARGVAGAELTEMNPELSSYFGAERGVLVLRVTPDTPASRAGLQAGDVIQRVNGQNLERVRDFRTAVSRARNRSIEMEVLRRGKPNTIRMMWE